MAIPTIAEIRAEILTGPLARQLAPFWNDVFGRHPTKGDSLKFREGHIKPDAAYEIHRLLTAGADARAVVLGWDGITVKHIQQAHDRRGA